MTGNYENKGQTPENKMPRAIAVGLNAPGYCESSDQTLDELTSLAHTAGAKVLFRVLQNMPAPDARTFIGKGKLEQISELARVHEADLLLFDDELSPSQLSNIERESGMAVLDRSMLILDIFAMRARLREVKIQVELAQLKYMLPRLAGIGVNLSRLGGGIGTRGPGESKLETDRRHIRSRISLLEQQLREVEQNRGLQRKKRLDSTIFKLCLIGYTNAGKSTLLNTLTGAKDAYTEDKLFATLDPLTRRFDIGDGRMVLVSDTVGFIRKLPHHLFDAFASTLEELKFADVLLHVVDLSDEAYLSHMRIVDELVEKLGAADKPKLIVYNKIDQADVQDDQLLTDGIGVSAVTGAGIHNLLTKITGILDQKYVKMHLCIPYQESALVQQVYKAASEVKESYHESGILLDVTMLASSAGRFLKYEV